MTGKIGRGKGGKTAILMMLVIAAVLAVGCEESKKGREAKEAEQARVEARAQERRMAREAKEQEETAEEERLAAEQEVLVARAMDEAERFDWYRYTDDPEAKAFRISTVDQLLGLAMAVNGYGAYADDFEGKTITLANDIDLSVYNGGYFSRGRGWNPIGSHGENLFRGTFDGAGKKIRGLYINDTTLQYAGLFGVTGGTVKNLGVENVNITGGNNVGGVVGFVREGVVINSHSTGTVSGGGSVGGVVGTVLEGRVEGCYSTATVSGRHGNVGGVVGKADGLAMAGGSGVIKCYFTGKVSGTDYVGGVVGYGSICWMNDCHATGEVSGTGRNIGGVAGFVSKTLNSSYFSGTVTGGDNVGGVIGYGSVANSYSTGTVTGDKNVGGVVGFMEGGRGGIEAKNSYSASTVSGTTNVGGVAGAVLENSYVSNCYSAGAVIGAESVGGIAGLVGIADENEEIGYMSSFGRVANSAALNPSVKGRRSGRVVGKTTGEDVTLTNNAAFAGLKDRGDRTDRWVVKGPETTDGADITAAEIASDPTLGGRFKEGWTTEKGKLPGLGGKAVDIPAHLRQ